MSDQQIVQELNWLIPNTEQWDIQSIDGNNFREVYPTKQDLARMKRIKRVPVEGMAQVLHFEDWATKDIDSWDLFYVWVRIRGCPDDLRRDYLGLFALGSLFGITQEVDMLFTRDRGIVRQRISVVDPEAIPGKANHTYDGKGFSFDVEVEPWQDTVMAEVPQDGDPKNGNGNDDEEANNANEKNNEQPKDVSKANSTTVSNPSPPQPRDKAPSGAVDGEFVFNVGAIEIGVTPHGTKLQGSTQVGVQSEPKKSWFQLVEEEEAASRATRSAPIFAATDIFASSGSAENLAATAKVLSKGAATPAALQATAELESEVDAAAESSSPKQTALITAFEAVADASTVAVHGLSSGSLDDHASNVVSVVDSCCLPNESPRVELSVDTSVPVRNAETSAISSPRTPGSSTSSRGTGVFLGGRYSQADIIAFGGIAMETAAEVRSSDRIRAQPNADDTQLERAQRLAQAKDHATSPGTNFINKYSLKYFTNEAVVATASKLGISLGKSPNEIEESVDKI
jgi:hypothetical protein